MPNAAPPKRRSHTERISFRIPDEMKEYLHAKARELDPGRPYTLVEMMDSVLQLYLDKLDELGTEHFGLPEKFNSSMTTITTKAETRQRLDKACEDFTAAAKQKISKTDVILDAIDRYREISPLKSSN